MFQSAWQSKYTWLAYDSDKKIMTCKICVEARKSNAFTQENSHFQTSTLSRHAANSDHQAALVGKSMESGFMKAISLFPSNILTGPPFFCRGGPATTQGKILVRTLNTVKPQYNIDPGNCQMCSPE